MPKPVWIIILLVLVVTGFDAARPDLTGGARHTASILERTEFWSFVVFAAFVVAALLFRKYRSRK